MKFHNLIFGCVLLIIVCLPGCTATQQTTTTSSTNTSIITTTSSSSSTTHQGSTTSSLNPTTTSHSTSTVSTTVTTTTTTTSLATTTSTSTTTTTLYNPLPPASPIKLIFIHHSSGQNWLADDNGGLGLALRDNNYFVSDTNYGWGPNFGGQPIGDFTDIGYWWRWFRSPTSSTYLTALYTENGQNCSYSRLGTEPLGENQIIMFKSCFPNSKLRGNQIDPVPAIDANPLRDQDSSSNDHTFANAKGIYIDLLNYFSSKLDKLFVIIAAPPRDYCTDPGNEYTSAEAANARAFNNWLVNGWLNSYAHNNVVVFDFYNVLTSNGGNPNTNDAGLAAGNHHRYRNSTIEHTTSAGSNFSAYPATPGGGDDHPTAAGNQKASIEVVPLLNTAYHRWVGH